jgi:hypothetical protein
MVGRLTVFLYEKKRGEQGGDKGDKGTTGRGQGKQGSGRRQEAGRQKRARAAKWVGGSSIHSFIQSHLLFSPSSLFGPTAHFARPWAPRSSSSQFLPSSLLRSLRTHPGEAKEQSNATLPNATHRIATQPTQVLPPILLLAYPPCCLLSPVCNRTFSSFPRHPTCAATLPDLHSALGLIWRYTYAGLSFIHHSTMYDAYLLASSQAPTLLPPARTHHSTQPTHTASLSGPVTYSSHTTHQQLVGGVGPSTPHPTHVEVQIEGRVVGRVSENMRICDGMAYTDSRNNSFLALPSINGPACVRVF